MHVVPTVAEVGFVIVKTDEASLVDEAEALRRLAVVLVNFGQAVFEFELLVVNGVAEWQFHKVELGEHLFHGRAHEGIEAVVVVEDQEAAAFEIRPHVARFEVAEQHIAVARGVHDRVIENFGAARLHGGVVAGVEIGFQVFVAKAGEVFQRIHVVVPVAAARVFEQGEFERGRRLLHRSGHKGCAGQKQNEKKYGPHILQMLLIQGNGLMSA